MVVFSDPLSCITLNERGTMDRDYFEKTLFGAAGGRSLDEQAAYIETHGTHGLPNTLRAFNLMYLGLPQPAAHADHVVITGCYPPFMDSRRLAAYVNLLKALNIDTTYLEKEYCCGVPLLRESSGRADHEAVIARSREFVRRNEQQALQKGASTLAYYCVGCAHTVKFLNPHHAHRHVYALDIVLPALRGRTLRLPPTSAAYFEGCHTRYEALCPNVSLNWPEYRKTLDGLEGLNLVEIPNTVCCTKKPHRIIEQAEALGVDTLITPCCGCSGSLSMAAGDTLKIKHLAEVLLDAVSNPT